MQASQPPLEVLARSNVEREVRSISGPLLYLSGLEERLVCRHSFEEIQQTKPDALLANVKALHLISQAIATRGG